MSVGLRHHLYLLLVNYYRKAECLISLVAMSSFGQSMNGQQTCQPHDSICSRCDMKPSLIVITMLVLIAACTVIIGSDNEATQIDNNDTDVLTGV